MISSYESSPKSKSVFTEVYTQKRGTCVTVVILGIIIGIFAFAYITFGNETESNLYRINSTLKLTSIIIHHGLAAPKFSFPNDVYNNDSHWQIGLGELTKKGKQNMYSLGKFFRERYSGFLSELYFSADIQVLSSYADTCVMSAAVLLAGLYPPHKFQVWNPHISWQPVPVKTISPEVDKMIDITQKCSKLVRKITEIETAIVNEDKTLPKLYDYLTQNTGMEVRNLSTLLKLYNLFSAQEASHLNLPEWSNLVYPYDMLNYTVRALEIETKDTEIAKLSTGVLLDKITSDMIKKNLSAIPTKMFLYSTHEKSIVNLFRILNKENKYLKPEYTSSIIIELHVIEGLRIVRVFYLEKVGKIPSQVNITECGHPCLLDNFIKFSEPLISHNWETDCS